MIKNINKLIMSECIPSEKEFEACEEQIRYTPENINTLIMRECIMSDKPFDTGKISDGYHTFDELYEHRIVLFIMLCKMTNLWELDVGLQLSVWKSRLHSDGTSFKGWFILGIGREKGKQITYHIPDEYWGDCRFEELEKAPEFDGHTSQDVLERLRKL